MDFRDVILHFLLGASKLQKEISRLSQQTSGGKLCGDLKEKRSHCAAGCSFHTGKHGYHHNDFGEAGAHVIHGVPR